MINQKPFFFFLLVFFSLSGFAQEILTAEEAVKISLENNYNIRLAKNSLNQDELRSSLGFAGILPQVNAVVQDNNSIQNLEQTRSDGTINSLDNAKNNSLAYGVALDWALFDGLRMFARYDELKELKNLGSMELKNTILNNTSNVLIVYYEIVQQKQQLSVLDSTRAISQQRVDLAHNRFIIGKAAKLEELNARVDLNTDQTLYLRQQEMLVNTKTELNLLLARDPQTEFIVNEEIIVDDQLFLPELVSKVKEENPQLLAQVINKRIAELQLKQIKANRYPTVTASTGYNFNNSESSLGFTTQSSAYGWNYGVRASMNIFDGFNQNRNEKIAKIDVASSKILVEQQQQELLAQLTQNYQTYQTNLSLMELEQENEINAKENLEITMDKYRIGTIPTIEFRTAQLNYINAQLRLTDATYQAKLSEIYLKALSGGLAL